MTTSLRKEYSKSKKRNERIVSEAAMRWLAENVIIINEKLDRKSVTRLINSIQKFEDTFGPFKSKIPSIGAHLDAAESGLQLVITGKSSDQKTSNMLKQLSYLYSSLSDFFTRDLSVLMKARIFKVAKEQPDQRINAIPSVSPDGSKHDLIVIRDSLANAIKPSAAEKKLLGKIYRSTKLPKLNANQVATELLSLSYNDLEELTNIGKVPMVATPEEAEDVAELGAEELTPPVPGEEKVATESVFRNRGQLLTEGIITEASIEEVGPVLQQVLQIVSNAGLTTLQTPINDLYSKLIGYLGSESGTQFKASLQQAGTKGGALADLFKTPGGKLLKQANMAIETLKGLGKAWPKIEPILNKPQISQADLASIEAILTKEVSGGFFKKAAQSFGITTQPYPGLSPEDIVDALRISESQAYARITMLERRLDEVDPPGQGQNAEAQAEIEKDRGGVDPNLAAPDLDAAALQGVEKIKKALSALHSFASGAADTAATGGTQASTTPQQTAAPATAKTSTGADGTEPKSPVAGSQQRGTNRAVNRADLPAQAEKFGVNSDQLEKILTAFGHPIEG